MENFYFSLAAGSQFKTAKELQYPYVLINFMSQTNYPPSYPYKNLFVDCGGFHSSLKEGYYTKTDEEYLEYIERIQPEFFALRDYPCEKELLNEISNKFKIKITPEMQIIRTLNNHISLLDLLDNYDIKSTYIPCLQGWTVEDYLNCIDLFKDHDLITDYMAIGSVCRRNAVKDIRKVILAVKNELPKTKLHGFGIKFSALKYEEVWGALYSVDSGAWDYEARWKKLKGDLCSSEASTVCAVNYIKKIDNLKLKNKSQQKLMEKYDYKQNKGDEKHE